jgi:hypothetical protein
LNPVTLLESFHTLLESWKSVFAQQRTFQRAQRLAYGLLAPLRAHLTSNAICATGRQFVDWTSDYRLFSQSPWDPHALFRPVFDRLPSLLPTAATAVVLALDDTLCKKTGRHIPGAATARDPQSLPFHVNLCRGLRFVQASLLVHGSEVPGPARALPVRFEPAPPATKPKWNASAEQREAYQAEKKIRALPQVGVQVLAAVRGELDARAGTLDRLLIASGDGSYTNRTVLRNLPARTVFIGRIRKNAKLCLPLEDSAKAPRNGRPRRYGCPAPTPQQVLEDTSLPVTKVHCFAAGAVREIPVKVLGPLYWRNVGPDLPLQLVVIKPLGYRLRNGSKLLYREPAFLICTDPDLPLPTLLQAYVDRWEIECNHRDEKSLLGVAEGQVWSPKAVTRLPQFQVALYSLLLLASMLSYGFQRTADYLPLPLWRRKSIRPSLLDLLNLLRDQLFALPLQSAPLAGFAGFAPSAPIDTKPTKPPLSAEALATVAA